MKKIKILSVGECSYLHSGYSRYNHGLLTELHKNPNYEVIEFGLSYHPFLHQKYKTPWQFIPNIPPELKEIDSEEKVKIWNAWAGNPVNALGGPVFNSVVLDVQPDIVIGNQDEWNLRYIVDSPLSRFYNTILLFACDSMPQKLEWLETMKRTDRVLTYSDWAKEQIEKQSPSVSVFGVASPSCQESFEILDRTKVRQTFGINPEAKIIGTVMRNQVRKRFPSLLSTFSKYLQKTKNTNTWLWIHSRYPDTSWDIPTLLEEYKVGHRVLFTYSCTNERCRAVFCAPYQDLAQCHRCRELSGLMPGPNNGISSDDLCRVYNCFDITTLYFTAEGFCIPAVESASCGVPTAVVNYSAPEDFIKKLEAIPINVKSMEKDIYTAQDRAIPDDDHLLEIWEKFFKKPDIIRNVERQKLRKLFEKHYGWDKCAKVWENAINSVGQKADWKEPLNIKYPAEKIDKPMNHNEFARWLIADVACIPERLFTSFETILVRNLTFETRCDIVGNGLGLPYNREIAYNEFRQIGEFRKNIEIARGEKLGLQ